MSIGFTCRGCGTSLHVRDELGGKTIPCRGCRRIVEVPIPPPDERLANRPPMPREEVGPRRPAWWHPPRPSTWMLPVWAILLFSIFLGLFAFWAGLFFD